MTYSVGINIESTSASGKVTRRVSRPNAPDERWYSVLSLLVSETDEEQALDSAIAFLGTRLGLLRERREQAAEVGVLVDKAMGRATLPSLSDEDDEEEDDVPPPRRLR